MTPTYNQWARATLWPDESAPVRPDWRPQTTAGAQLDPRPGKTKLPSSVATTPPQPQTLCVLAPWLLGRQPRKRVQTQKWTQVLISWCL